MAVYAYLFEIKSIQNFLFAGEKLKDMICASEMIARITQDVFDTVVLQLDIEVKVIRKAGGALYLVSSNQEQLEQFQEIWTLVVSQIIPGSQILSIVTPSADNDFQAIKLGLAALSKQKNHRTVELPVAAPIAERSPRTGQAAISNDYLPNNTRELVDSAITTKRKFGATKTTMRAMTSRFSPSKMPSTYKWPTALESSDFPFITGHKQRIAIIHIDGNGLGIILRQLQAICEQYPEIYSDLYSDFSVRLETALESSAQSATQSILLPHARPLITLDGSHSVIPARPLILGGDDLTIVVRADLALAYTEYFIKSFEKQTHQQLKELKAHFSHRIGSHLELVEQLTACAGIVYQKSNQPFSMGYQLAESCCAAAKTESRSIAKAHDAIPSSLMFMDIQSSLTGNVSDMIERERTLKVKEGSSQLTLGVYGLDDSTQLASLSILNALYNDIVEAKSVISVSKIRALLGEAHHDMALYSKSLERLDELANKYKQNINSVMLLLKQIKDGNNVSALGDVLTYAKYSAENQGGSDE
jgi:hypothetical protein